jgi:hypothetical protein
MSQQIKVNSAPVVASPFAQVLDGVDSSQQAVPVPIVRGTQKVALTWATVIYNLNPQPTPGGKSKK